MSTRSSKRLQIDDIVEVLLEDDDSQSRWVECLVLSLRKKRVQVKHWDSTYVDIEEWVPVGFAPKDQLGMRLDGRLNIRPCPKWDPSRLRFGVGKPVDVWRCDGWCEGVMVRKHHRSAIEVYLPGENKCMTFERADMRVSKEWLKGRWMSLDAKPDILSTISSLNKKPTKRRPVEVTLPKDRPPRQWVLALECPGEQSSPVAKKRKRASKNSKRSSN